MGFSQPHLRLLVWLLTIGLFAATSFADEVIIDGKQGSKISIGDFDCSKCPGPSASVLNLLNGCESSSLTAGKLWQFFDSQGVDSLDRLTLCLDVESHSGLANAEINSMELKIEDPLGGLLTNVSLGNNSLSIPGYDIAAFKPEAKLEIALGYDFMQRFSADSTEKISLNVSGASNSQPVISVQGVEGKGFFSSLNSFALVAFVVFWALVFISLYRFTKPPANESERKNVIPPERRALSA